MAPVTNVWEFISNLKAMPLWTGVLEVDGPEYYPE